MKKADWYFDFISPFAYIGLARLGRFSETLEIRYRPFIPSTRCLICGFPSPPATHPSPFAASSKPCGRRATIRPMSGPSPISRIRWGADAMDFVEAYLADPRIIATDEMKRAANLPAGASRKRN